MLLIRSHWFPWEEVTSQVWEEPSFACFRARQLNRGRPNSYDYVRQARSHGARQSPCGPDILKSR